MDQPTASRTFDELLDSHPALSGERLCSWRPMPYCSIPFVNRLTQALTLSLGPAPVVLTSDLHDAVVHAMTTATVYAADGTEDADTLIIRAMRQALTGDGSTWDVVDLLDPALQLTLAQHLSEREMHVVAQLAEHVGHPCSARVQDLVAIDEAEHCLRETLHPDVATEERIWPLAVALGMHNDLAWLALVDEYAEKLDGQELADWRADCDAALRAWSEQPRLFDCEEPGVSGGVGLLEEDVSGGGVGSAAGGDVKDAGAAADAGDSAGVGDANGPAPV